MSSVKAALCALVAAALFHPAGAAAAEGGNWSVGVSGGTIGISPEIGYRFNRAMGVRVNGGFFDYDRNEEIDDIDYDGTLKLKSFGAMADLYPFGGSFRISAGLRSSKNRIDLSAVPTANVEIGDGVFTPAEVGQLDGRVTFKKMNPAVTVGWGGKLKRGFSVGFEAGVMMQGSPKMSLAASGGTLSNDPTFQQELEDERARAEKDAEDFKLWPVLQLHLKYRF
ncbi:MAG TPA: hypothetical protein VNQ32_06670 [Steroidobacteraceae bacterium]|nr:hypothetical protein [Steroidobacteraceae bacterium]